MPSSLSPWLWTLRYHRSHCINMYFWTECNGSWALIIDSVPARSVSIPKRQRMAWNEAGPEPVYGSSCPPKLNHCHVLTSCSVQICLCSEKAVKTLLFFSWMLQSLSKDEDQSIQSKHQQGFPISKLVSENSFLFIQEPTVKQPLPAE